MQQGDITIPTLCIWSLHPEKAPWCIQLVPNGYNFGCVFWSRERVWFWFRLLPIREFAKLSDFDQMGKKTAPIMYMIHMTYASLHWIWFEGKGSVATWSLFSTFPRHQSDQCFWTKNCLNLKQFERQNYHKFIKNLLHLYCPRHPFALEWALDLKKFSWSHSIRDTWAEITCRSRSMPQALACGSSIRL